MDLRSYSIVFLYFRIGPMQLRGCVLAALIHAAIERQEASRSGL